MPRRIAAALIACALSLSFSAALAQPPRPTPYMASIASGRAMMRRGPGQTYPGVWLYVRRDLPIRVIRIHGDWRQIQDPGGTTGWMLVSLLSDQRTAIVRGEGLAPMHEAPDEASPTRFRAEPNVVGRVSRCGGGWCNFDVGGRAGYIRVDRIWGVDPGETIR
ncbi:MAG TPA: SH3 domain-containing protein [Allosphingosinicella sp.]|jgi:SH3-like domain-containing protein|nr:SH3 domain-containing protein [Allosphingosinicella sp.]